MSSRVEVKKPNRREFLYYLGGASIVLFGAEIYALLQQFTQEPVPEAERPIRIDLSQIPTPETSPAFFQQGKYYLVNINNSLIALDAICIFRPVTVKWVKTNDRFECPHCGSKFHLDGSRIEGPVSRGLNQIVLEVKTSKGVITTSSNGDPVSLADADTITLYPALKFQGKPRA